MADKRALAALVEQVLPDVIAQANEGLFYADAVRQAINDRFDLNLGPDELTTTKDILRRRRDIRRMSLGSNLWRPVLRRL